MVPDRLKPIIGNFSETETEMVVSAYRIAENALKEKVRGNNKPFIEHPLGVAGILCNEMGMMADSVTAMFLHEANRFQADNAADLNKSELLNTLRGSFPADIIDIVISLNNISFITLQETNLDEERYRKLIISYSTDPRVVLIKLADRLEVMRHLDILPPSKHKSKIMETILLYIPIAHQLGLYRLKSELEDLFLKYAEPEQYRAINNHIMATERDREKLVNKFVIPLREKLTNNGIKYTLKTRTKSTYSIWKKMQAQKVTFDKIYDVFAIRFIIDSPPDKETEHALCWKVYSLVTEEYTPDSSRFRDWLSFPKDNGYESLHTTVTTKEGTSVEVQIRTARMDYIAEQGHAAHWSYKGIKSEEGLSSWLNKVRNMMQSTDSSKYQQISPIVLGEIFVFTPTGDLRQLPEGATVLDFAFDVHTNLGVKCSGGRINGKMVPIKEKLKTGDVVDIISNKNQKPTADWLNIVVTSKARNRIKQKIKEEENKRASIGKELLERRLKNWKLEMGDEDLSFLVKKYKYRTINEFFGAVGDESIDLMEIKEFLSDDKRYDRGREIDKSDKYPIKEQSSDYLIIGGKLNNVDYKMAKCCNPIYGDEVFGFVTIKDGIKIHRMSCPNAARLIESYPYRIQKVKWKESIGKGSFQVAVKVIADGDESISNQVITTVNSFKTSIRAFSANERMKGDYEINLQLFVPSNLELDKIIASLKKIKEVKQVSRL
ncbi:MAG: RelA/SpoT family protein [Bacteroidales bacterium]|nr:RelA/SpoT family protein [Bacteroidales bacterium]MDD4670638.1 RelA/SpoT family protein [Bacteroidales bacterium]